MNLLMKLAGLWIALGFGFGLVAKSQLKGPYRIIPLVISLAPLMSHLSYGYVQATEIPIEESQLALYLGSSLVLLGIVFWVGWQSLQRNGASLMLLPIVMAVIYTFGPLTWLINASEAINLGVNSMPTLLFYAGTLFVASLLLAFRLRLPKFPERKKVDPEEPKPKRQSRKARTQASATKPRNARAKPSTAKQRRSSKRP